MVKSKGKHNSYNLNQSPLFKLKSKKKLADILGMSVKDIESLANRPDNYRVFSINKDHEKSRNIEQPKPHLERVHRRIFNLLARIEAPHYLHSGVIGRSYISNAEAHINSREAITLDIKSFFPSTLGWHVFEFYQLLLGCSNDVAGLLTKLSIVNGHIPTGSCLSQILAFYSNKEMLDEISTLAISNGLTMTCYVDDITISGDQVGTLLLYNVRGILQRRGLRSALKKEMIYKSGSIFHITGTIIRNHRLFLPNRKHEVIHNEIFKILKILPLEEKHKQLEQTIGRVIAGAMLDPSMHKHLRLLRQEVTHTSREIRKKNNE